MTTHPNWHRVGRGRPPCPICGKGDWCVVSADGAVALCQRVESSKRCGDAGWLHRLREANGWRPTQPVLRAIDRKLISAGSAALGQLSAHYQSTVIPSALTCLSQSLGLSVSSLFRLGIGWSIQHDAWSFPMTDGQGNVLGIRLRRPNGFKFSVKGGHEGLFVPQRPHDGAMTAMSSSRLLVCEGPTDTAALMDMGFDNVVGRPSCSGGVKLLAELVQRIRPNDAVIVADADEPGQFGAAILASALAVHVPIVRVIAPPGGFKDARIWRQAGATRRDVEQIVQTARARQLVFRAHNLERKG